MESLNEGAVPYCGLSILKQCLLFDRMTAKSLYQVASHLDLYLSDYIDDIHDLEEMFKCIDPQIYRPILNKLTVNMTTEVITSLRLARKKKPEDA